MAGLDLSRQTILVVEDESFSRTILVRMLTGMGGPTILQAGDGEEAMQLLWTAPGLSFVISDLNMPIVNGLQLLKAVRTGQCGVDRSMPFAMLTGYSDKNLVEIALRLDVNSFVIKPVAKEALEKRLGHLLRSARDTSWLKPAETYQHIDTKITVTASLDAIASKGDALREHQNDAGHVGLEIVLGERGKRAARGARATPRPSKSRGEKFSDADVAGMQKEKFANADIAGVPGSSVVRRLSSLRGKFQDSDLAGDIVAGISHLVAELGDDNATSIVDALDAMAQGGELSLDDIAGALAAQPGPNDVEPSRAGPPAGGQNWIAEFRALTAIPAGAILARDIRTKDGNVFIRANIRMSRLIIRLLVHLDGLKVLALENDDATGARGGVYVRFQRTASADTLVPGGQEDIVPAGSGRMVDLADISEGATVARSIYTVDGHLYLPAGAMITPRILALLQDLRDLEKLALPIWIV